MTSEEALDLAQREMEAAGIPFAVQLRDVLIAQMDAHPESIPHFLRRVHERVAEAKEQSQ